LENFLTAYVVGTPELNGLYSRYVKQISRDALGQFDGQINAIIADEFGLDAFRYVGSIIDDSRAQCVRWVGKRILEKSEMQSEIAWANNNGTGMIPGTNPDNFLVFRGGYNCRHRAIPFKLTKSQRERLQKEQTTEATEETKKTQTQINEVKKDVLKNQIVIERNIGNSTIQKRLFVTSQSQKMVDEMTNVLSGNDGSVEIINKKGVYTLLRNPSESTENGGKQLRRKFNQPFASFGTISETANGNCAKDNSYLNVKIKPGDFIEFKKVPMNVDVDSLLKNGYTQKVTESGRNVIARPSSRKGYLEVVAYENPNGNGFKFWSVRMASNTLNKNQNIAPTIVHESNHLIQNAKDPNKTEFKLLFNRKKFDLNDAPTEYGKTNLSEFWAESLTYYVFDNPGLKKDYPKIFDFVEEYLEKIGVDKKTIKIAE
jgi:hypothetical protein